MKEIELRRHSVRDKPETDLSPAGLELAREVGREAGPFQLCVTSPVPRALQTAQAMGAPSPEVDRTWGEIPAEVVEEIGWPSPFLRVAEAVRRGGASARMADRLLQAALVALARVDEGERLLVVTHGGFPELVSVRALPRSDPRTWGGVLRCMEGVRIRVEGVTPTHVSVLRVPDARTRV